MMYGLFYIGLCENSFQGTAVGIGAKNMHLFITFNKNVFSKHDTVTGASAADLNGMALKATDSHDYYR